MSGETRGERGRHKPEQGSSACRSWEVLRKAGSEKPNPLTLEIQLLGEFVVKVGNEQVDDGRWYLRKAKSLLKLLSLAPQHTLHRDQLIETLWPTLGIDAGSNNLHKVLYVARSALEPGRNSRHVSPFLQLRADLVILDAPDGLTIDVAQFMYQASIARETRDRRALETALSLYTGDLLPEDRYEDWAIEHRENLRALWLHCLTILASLQQEEGDVAGAINTLRLVLKEDELNEDIQAQLIGLLAANGQRAAALRQYERFRLYLQRELQAEPDEDLKILHQQILSGQSLKILRRTLRGSNRAANWLD